MRRNLSIVAFLGAFFQTTHSGPAVKKGTLSTVVPPKVVAIVPLSFNDEENSITTRSFLVESNDGQNDVWNYIDSSNLPSTDLNTSPR